MAMQSHAAGRRVAGKKRLFLGVYEGAARLIQKQSEGVIDPGW